MALLRGVVDPELGSDIVELGMAKGATVDADGLVDITIALTTSGCPLRAQIQRDVRARIGGLPGVTKVHITWTELTPDEKAAAMANPDLLMTDETVEKLKSELLSDDPALDPCDLRRLQRDRLRFKVPRRFEAP